MFVPAVAITGGGPPVSRRYTAGYDIGIASMQVEWVGNKTNGRYRAETSKVETQIHRCL